MAQIEKIIEGLDSVAITGHVRPDGDCIGSTLALYNYIKENHKSIDVSLFLEKAGEEFNYLSRIEEIKNDADDKKYDLIFCMDSSSADRFEPFSQVYENAGKKICIDHHVSNTGYADLTILEADASSTCEVLFTLLDSEKISKTVAECIYTGIIHDTGVFKYSCTKRRTMEIAGFCMDMGIDYSSIIDNSFYKKTYVQNQILGRALLESVLFYNGKCIFSFVGKQEMDFYGIDGKDLGGVVEQLRLTDGVEVAIFIYQVDEETYKVSMRSKSLIDVAKIATAYGGGGHARAAGFNSKLKNVHAIINKISEDVERQYGELDK